MLLALGSRGIPLASISWLSISFSLSVSLSISMSMGDNLGVVTNNSGAMVDLLVCLLAVLGHNILALLNVCGVNNDIIFLMAFLSLVLDGLLVALLVWFAEALEVVVRLVTIAWLSLSLGITSMMTSMDDLGDNVNTFLNIGGVHNYIILLMADLFMIGVAFLGLGNIIDNMTLGLIASLMTWFSNRPSQSGTSKKKNCTHFKHHSGVSLPTNSLEKEL